MRCLHSVYIETFNSGCLCFATSSHCNRYSVQVNVKFYNELCWQLCSSYLKLRFKMLVTWPRCFHSNYNLCYSTHWRTSLSWDYKVAPSLSKCLPRDLRGLLGRRCNEYDFSFDRNSCPYLMCLWPVLTALEFILGEEIVSNLNKEIFSFASKCSWNSIISIWHLSNIVTKLIFDK